MDQPARSLIAQTRGQLIAMGDADYDEARTSYNGLLDRRPRLIHRPTDVADVVAAVRWAVDQDIGIAVRGGGHNVAGHSMPDDAFVIDLSRWRGARVDAVGGTVTALGGSLLMDLDAATAGHGFAVPSGTYVDTGIAGLTLGGGIGYLLPSAGFACDALVGVQLVTADGRVIEVDAEREPDLLWALRGGGGNFGVVTRFRYAMTPVERMYGGEIRFMGEGVRDVLERVFDLDRDGPDELALQADVWWSDAEDVPGLTLLVAWRGDQESGDAAIGELSTHTAVRRADLRPMSWLELQARNRPRPFGWRNYWKGHLVRETSPALAAAVLEALEGAHGEDQVLIELIHGQAHRIARETAAFGGRHAAANVTALAIWSDPSEDDARISWARRGAGFLAPFSLTGGGYLNYPEVDQPAERVAAAFGAEVFGRLRRIKSAVDPANRFRYNANIPPA